MRARPSPHRRFHTILPSACAVTSYGTQSPNGHVERASAIVSTTALRRAHRRRRTLLRPGNDDRIYVACLAFTPRERRVVVRDSHAMQSEAKWLNHRTGTRVADGVGMRTLLGFFSILSVVACSGAVERTELIAAECAAKPPVPVTTRAEILRLDVVQFGERFRQEPGSFASLGMNLDGRCSTTDETTHACTRVPGSTPSERADGDGGIDNAFGRALLPMLTLLDERPSDAASGTSFLVLEGGGRATLHVGSRSGQIIVSIPITSVRLAEGEDGLVTLAGVIPPAEFRETIAARVNALVEPPNTELCTGVTLPSILDAVDRAADIRLDLVPNRNEQCNAISIGVRFRASPVTAMPALPPTCAEQIANDANTDG